MSSRSRALCAFLWLTAVQEGVRLRGAAWHLHLHFIPFLSYISVTPQSQFIWACYAAIVDGQCLRGPLLLRLIFDKVPKMVIFFLIHGRFQAFQFLVVHDDFLQLL